ANEAIEPSLDSDCQSIPSYFLPWQSKYGFWIGRNAWDGDTQCLILKGCYGLNMMFSVFG
ncbi:hypothetical protein MKX03_029564, partial [Papaver bracteatum]